jgi:hypothetical protein
MFLTRLKTCYTLSKYCNDPNGVTSSNVVNCPNILKDPNIVNSPNIVNGPNIVSNLDVFGMQTFLKGLIYVR